MVYLITEKIGLGKRLVIVFIVPVLADLQTVVVIVVVDLVPVIIRLLVLSRVVRTRIVTNFIEVRQEVFYCKVIISLSG